MKDIQYLKSKKYYEIFKDYLEVPEPLNMFDDWPKPLNFERCLISIFDHRLNNEEYISKITSFGTFLYKIHEERIQASHITQFCRDYYDIEAKFISFYISLYKDFKVVFYDDEEQKFYKCRSLRKYIELCENSIREKKFIDLYIPEIKTVILGNYDFTPVIYYKDNKNFLKIKEYVDRATLHILT